MGIFEHYQSRYEERKQEEFTIGEFLEICKEDQISLTQATRKRLFLATTLRQCLLLTFGNTLTTSTTAMRVLST